MSDIQDRIAAARREAENLKARIKAKKEELADADCEHPDPCNCSCVCDTSHFTDCKCSVNSATGREGDIGASPPYQYESQKEFEGTFGEDLRHALVDRQKTPCFRFARWKVDYLGRLHDEQGPRDSPSLLVGHDLCLRSLRKLCRMWRSRQHLFRLQLVNSGRTYTRRP